jgi:hypothetical protein
MGVGIDALLANLSVVPPSYREVIRNAGGGYGMFELCFSRTRRHRAAIRVLLRDEREYLFCIHA